MKGVHRVIIAVKDMDKAMHMFKTLLGGQWHDVGIVQGGLARAAWGFESGIELIAPLDPNDDSPIARNMRATKSNALGYPGGQGLWGVFFNVDDLDQADARAKSVGVRQHPVAAWRRITIPSYKSPVWNDPANPLHDMPGVKKAMQAYKQTIYDEISFNSQDCFGVSVGVGRFDSPVGLGANRVLLLVKEANLHKLLNVYGGLLGGRWYDQGLVEDGKVRALWNFEAGIEVVSPAAPGYLADLLKEHGEGLLSVFFNVEDPEKAAARAKTLGLKESRRMSIPGYKSSAWNDPANPLSNMPTLKKAVLDSKLTRYDQIMYLPDPSCGMSFGIGCYQTQG